MALAFIIKSMEISIQERPHCLVLHGSFMSADSMAPLIKPFAATRPVIALDARGHGRTGDLPGPITYEQMADDSAGVLDALKVRSADVLGYSMGGDIKADDAVVVVAKAEGSALTAITIEIA
jgi:pimeloyl-ACP methyl ester carboxylesterase